MKEALELFALMAAVLFLVLGIIIFIAVHKTNKKEFLRFGTTFTILGAVLMLPGWDYFYTSGFWRVPTPPPPAPTIAQIQQQQQIQAWQKEKEEQEREANSPERLKQLELEKKWVGSCCDAAGIEMRRYVVATGLTQDVSINTMDYDVDKNGIVGVKIYLSYKSVESQANKNFQENLKQKLELILLDKLLVQYKRSQVLIGFDENKGNWDK